MDALTLITTAKHHPRYPTEFNSDYGIYENPVIECAECSLAWSTNPDGMMSRRMLEGTRLAPEHAGQACRSCKATMEVE